MGVVLSILVSAILANFGIPTVLTAELMLFGIAFSVIVGIISGIMPARNAGSIQPVEALKYE